MKIQNGISIAPPSAESKDTQLREAAQMYEGYFLDQMVRAMRSTVPKDAGILKKNFAEEIFTGQLDQQYVENWTKRGGVGLADMIYNQIRERVQPFQGVKQQGVIPLSPKPEMHGVPTTDSIQMKMIPSAQLEYRFEVPNPSGGVFEAQAPMSGKVLDTAKIGDGWSAVLLDPGQGVTSELTFPGSCAQIGPGDQVGTGQRLGLLDSGRPVLAWKLDWNKDVSG